MDKHEKELRKRYLFVFYDSKEMYMDKLKVSERDQLLIRLDERTSNIWNTVEKLEIHVAKSNGFIKDNLVLSNSNRTWIKVHRWILGGTITALGIMWSKFQGWW